MRGCPALLTHSEAGRSMQLLNNFSIGQRLYGAFLGAALITLATGVLAIYFTQRVGDNGIYVGESAAPLVDAVMESKLLTTEAHLVFEEIMGGDDAESIDNVHALLSQARWYLNVIAQGGENDEGRYLPATNPSTVAMVPAAMGLFDSFQSTLNKRYATRGQGLPAGEFHHLDAEFDAQFDAYIHEVDKLESAIQEDIKGSLANLRDTVGESRVHMSVIVAAALVMGLALGWFVGSSPARSRGPWTNACASPSVSLRAT